MSRVRREDEKELVREMCEGNRARNYRSDRVRSTVRTSRNVEYNLISTILFGEGAHASPKCDNAQIATIASAEEGENRNPPIRTLNTELNSVLLLCVPRRLADAKPSIEILSLWLLFFVSVVMMNRCDSTLR